MRKSRLSWHKQSRLIELFVAGSTARTSAQLVGVNKTTAAYYFLRLRELIYFNSEDVGLLEGEIEVDESYFGGTRKGKRGRGASGKVPVFGLLKRNGKVYAAMIPDAKTKTLMPIIRDKVQQIALFIQIVGVDIMRLMYQSLNIIVLTIVCCLQIRKITSME